MSSKRIFIAACRERINCTEVIAPAGDNVPYATTWVFHVAAEPRNNVYVKMGHRLTGSGTRVETYVKAIGVHVLIELLLYQIDQIENCKPFCAGRRKPIGNYTSRDNKRVPWRDREPVADRKCKVVGRDPTALCG